MKRILAFALTICLLVSCFVFTATAAIETDFTDISTHWAKEEIERTYERGLMNGVGQSRFAPDGSISRAMIITVLYRIDEKYNTNHEAVAEDATPTFTDVPAGSWYTRAVAWAENKSIVNGVKENQFAPDAAMTRQDAATVLFRYAQYLQTDTSARGELLGYIDEDKIASYAKDAVAWAVGSYIIYGTSNYTLTPKGIATRAQFAVLSERILIGLGFMEGQLGPDKPADPSYGEYETSNEAYLAWVMTQWPGTYEEKHFVEHPTISGIWQCWCLNASLGFDSKDSAYVRWMEDDNCLQIHLAADVTGPQVGKGGFNKIGRDIAATILAKVFPDGNTAAELVELMNKALRLEIVECCYHTSYGERKAYGILRYIENRMVKITYYQAYGEGGGFLDITIGEINDKEIYDEECAIAIAKGLTPGAGLTPQDIGLNTYDKWSDGYYVNYVKVYAIPDLFES